MKNSILKGSILIGLGASSYGMLATFVTMAYRQGFSTAEVTLAQFGIGFAGLLVLTMIRKKTAVPYTQKTSIKSRLKLIAAGTSMGLTSVFYYMAVRYIPVSVAIVLLMQTVWMGVILEMVLHRKTPGLRKIISVCIVLGGTILATGLGTQTVRINGVGFGWGMLAAVTYTATMYSSNNIELRLPSLKRSLYMIMGGLIIIALIFHSAINRGFSYGIFLHWGLILALFGTILPPLLFTEGMPLTGMGLGAIIAAVEIPVSVFMAYLLLHEPVSALQWLGVMLILCAVVLMNIEKKGHGQAGWK